MTSTTYSSHPRKDLLPPADRIADLLERGRLAEAVAHYIAETDYVAFNELREIFKGKGALALFAAPNTVVANGLSPELASTIADLINSGRITLWCPTSCTKPKRVTVGPTDWPCRVTLLPQAKEAKGHRKLSWLFAELRAGVEPRTRVR